jgi:DNA polymerase III delta prime subunit
MYISNKPWVEKYRPLHFNDIVLDNMNYLILNNIIKKNSFPNMLLYGPPGTGKTTTIINLINLYQDNNNNRDKGLMIHLNASDERGIDIIRNQISTFVNSQSLFVQGLKFVVLDEVDYMTKNAQQALKHLIHTYNDNVRFCLICNYISRIDDSLKNEFIHLRFNQLPEDKIIDFLNNINTIEKLNLSRDVLQNIQKIFKSDIRSMVNYMQSNEHNLNINKEMIISDNIWHILTIKIKTNPKDSISYIYEIIKKYNIDIKNIIKDYVRFIINNNIIVLSSDYLKFTEFIIHLTESNIDDLINYFVEKTRSFLLNITQTSE